MCRLGHRLPFSKTLFGKSGKLGTFFTKWKNLWTKISVRDHQFADFIIKDKQSQCFYLPDFHHAFFFWYIHTSYIIFRCSPRGFSATCLQQMQGSVVEGLSQTATSSSQRFFVWDIRLCPQLTVHNAGISLLLSTSVWVLLSPPDRTSRD